MSYLLAADAVLLLHVLFVAFVIAGLLRSAGDAEVPAMTPDNTLDVRGERVDDEVVGRDARGLPLVAEEHAVPQCGHGERLDVLRRHVHQKSAK